MDEHTCSDENQISFHFNVRSIIAIDLFQFSLMKGP